MSDASDENAKNSAEREDAAPELAGAATVNRSGRKRGSRVQTYVVIGLLASAVGYVGYSMFKQSDLAPSRISRGPNVDATPAGQQQADSERYQQSLDAVNQQGAQTADQSGGSFLATPDEPLRNIDDIRDVTKEPYPRQRPVAPANEVPTQRVENFTPDRRQAMTPDDYSDINTLAGAMAAQAASLASQWSPKGSVNTIVLNQTLYKSPEQRQAEAEAARQAALSGNGGVVDGANMLIKAGQILFARTVNASDSDTPGPVVAEIFQRGPLYRARMLGSFQQNRNTNALIVEFSRLVMADGTEVPISAYAVDGAKGSIAVKSDVDHRWLARYGPRLAGAFISGLGETMSRPSQEIIIGNNSTTVVDRETELKDALYAGAGRVGDQLASEIEDMAPSGPLVKLGSGYTIGVLFMQGVPNVQATVNSVATR
jgi:intracellular multiplication protein IcmE